MAAAILSLVRGQSVADDVAMTGEITLTGQVLPVGGIREKVLAAQRAGIGKVVLPSENEPDLEELPAETREAVQFVLADSLEEVLGAAFDGTRKTGPRRTAPHRQAATPAGRS